MLITIIKCIGHSLNCELNTQSAAANEMLIMPVSIISLWYCGKNQNETGVWFFYYLQQENKEFLNNKNINLPQGF